MKNETLHIRLKANMQKSLTNFKTWLVLSVFVLLGAIVPQEAKANYDSRGLWYFDNTNTKWTNVYLIVGRGDWTQAVKMVLQYDNIYKAESTWDNTYAFFFADSACGYTTGSGSGKDIVGSRTGNYTSNFTSKPSNNIFSPSGNGTNITGTWSTAYHLKHPWGTGNDNDWSWKVLKYNDGVYTLNALYASGKGCNYSKPNSTDEAGYVSNPTLVGSPTIGDECIFTFNPSNNAITITKVVQCNEITDVSSNFSLSETTYDYNGEPKKPTVSSTLNGIGDITTKYYNSEGNVVSEPTNAGTYTVKITVSQSTTYCALTTETVVGTYTINKIDQSAITIANTKTTFCGFPANNQVTLNIDGGNGDGDVVYTSEDEDIATISGNILTVKAEGTVTISAQKQAGTNHNASNTATKSFTFYKAPDAPVDKQVDNLVKCDVTTTDGLITLNNYNANYTYSISPAAGGDAENGYKISAAGNYTITVTRNVNESCSLSTSSALIAVALTDNTPAATVSITGENSICNGQSTTLTCNVSTTNGNVQSYQWNLNDTPIQGATESTYNASETGNYTVVVTVSNDGCTDEFTNSTPFNLTVNPIPDAPSLTSPAPVCEGTKVNLPTEGLKWYNAETDGTEVLNTAITATGTYWAAALQNECESATRTRYDVTVNPKPTINIGENVTAVKFEDVVLTATGNNIADVTWTADKGTITKDATDPKRAVLTYDQADAVIVTATATSAAGCTSVAATKTVTFSAEDCNSTTITDLIITCNPNGYYGDVYLHIWPNGESSLKSWPGFQGEWKDNVWRWEISASLLNTSKKYDIIFNNNSGAQTQDLDHDLIPGNQYNYTLNHTDWGNSNNRPTMSKVDPIPLSQPAAITAPTVKTVYAESDEGEGNIRFKGQVVKTGCNDKAKLAVQYKLHENNSYTTYYWNNEDKLVDIEAGKEFEITLTNIPDGTYDVRARIYVSDDLKGYGEVITIPVSTIKEPITSVVLTHVRNQAGESYSDQELANLTYCVGNEVWFELNYEGSKFIPENNVGFKWTTYPGNNLIGPYNDNKYKFTITGSGTIGISLRNEANVDGEGNPTWVESNLLEFNTHPVAISPTISFENATICSNSTATLKLGALVVGQSYELYKEIENEGVYSEERVGDVTLTCNSIEDDLEFTGLNESGKYFVKGYTAQCPDYKVSSQTATLEIVNASSVYITLDPTEATTTPWMPVKFTVAASDDYTLEVPEGVEFNQNGNICSVKIPLPQGATIGEGQYENVSFPQDATTSYTVTAKLVSTGGEDNPCAVPATATITLTPYVEDCTIGH